MTEPRGGEGATLRTARLHRPSQDRLRGGQSPRRPLAGVIRQPGAISMNECCRLVRGWAHPTTRPCDASCPWYRSLARPAAPSQRALNFYLRQDSCAINGRTSLVPLDCHCRDRNLVALHGRMREKKGRGHLVPSWRDYGTMGERSLASGLLNFLFCFCFVSVA